MNIPKITPGSPQLVAMVHVHSNNALQNTIYNDGFGISTYSPRELSILENARKKLALLSADLVKETQLEILSLCRSSVFLLKQKEVEEIEKQIAEIEFVKQLIERALKEVEIYIRNGINIISIENVGAPYFIGNEVPFEDLLILNIVAKSIRANFPDVYMGVHVLSSDEIESLPIAILCKAFFVRSESSIFSGFRPEGKTINRGNLAKFFYLRNYFHAKNGMENIKERRFPVIWSDLQKKHTIFDEEVTDLKIWLDNIFFQKIEGIILTGAETGSVIAERDLSRGREAIEKLKLETNRIFNGEVEIAIPLITGSGMDMKMYKKYADFIITGAQLKENKYWENAVNEDNVKALVEKLECE